MAGAKNAVKKQAAICRQNKPWEQSTGPKTPEGKAATQANGLKHGLFTQEGRALLEWLDAQNGIADIHYARAMVDIENDRENDREIQQERVAKILEAIS